AATIRPVRPRRTKKEAPKASSRSKTRAARPPSPRRTEAPALGLLLTLELRRELAEKLSLRAIEEGRNTRRSLWPCSKEWRSAGSSLASGPAEVSTRAMPSVKAPYRPRPALQYFTRGGRRGLLCGLDSQGIFRHGSRRPPPHSLTAEAA